MKASRKEKKLPNIVTMEIYFNPDPGLSCSSENRCFSLKFDTDHR